MLFNSQAVNEAYFGKTSEILAIEQQLHIFRNKYMGSYVLNTGVNSDPDLIKFDRMMEDYFGFGCFTMKIINEPLVNGMTCPVDYRFDVNRSADDLIATKKGFKFKKEFDYSLLMYTYSGVIFNDYFEDGEIMALILHEVGHNFNSALNKKQACMTDLYITIAMIGSIILACAGSIPNAKFLVTNTNAWRGFADKLGREWREDGVFFTKAYDLINDMKSLLKAGVIYTNSISRVLTFGASYTLNFAINIIKRLRDTLLNPLSLLFSPMKYRNERGADNFATMYGYGPEEVSLMEKFNTTGPDSANQIMKTVDKIPLISTLIHLNEFPIVILKSLIDDHPTEMARCMDQLELLRREVKKEDLDPKMKKVIQSDIDACEIQLKKLTDLKNGIKDPYLAKRAYNRFLLSINGDFKHFIFDNNKFDQYDSAYERASE